MICCNQECCTRDGEKEFTRHLTECMGTIGAFLLVKECSVLLMLGPSRRCVWGSLYLDQHGEEDWKMRRGKQMWLNSERVETVRKLLVQQNAFHDTKVLHVSVLATPL